MSEFKDIIAKYQIPEPECGWEEHDRIVAADRARMAAKDSEDRITSIGVPARISDAMAGTVRPTKAIEAMRVFFRAAETLAVLSGSPGCGKTFAAAVWLVRAPTVKQKNPIPRKFITSTDFCRISDYDREDFDRVSRAALLVLDDVGQEYGDKRSYFAQRLETLLASRHANKLLTVITSNLGPDALGEVYGSRLSSRLKDAHMVVLRNEKDLRGSE